MPYTYSTAVLVTDITNRLKDLRPAPLLARWNEDLIRDAIKEALKWAEPLGELRVIAMSTEQYETSPQPDYDVLEIRKVEVTTTTRGWVEVPQALWRLERTEDAWLIMVNAPTTETIRVTAICRYNVENIAEKVSGAYLATFIKADSMMITLYAMSVLLEGDVQYGLPSQVASDEAHMIDFRAQAELRKQLLLAQQNPAPPPQPEQRRNQRR